MAVTVRLFAALREAAGTSQVEVDSDTVPHIVAALCGRFGEPFASRVTVASGLLDGQPVKLDAAVVAADGAELALLPPFSGGATVTAVERRLSVALITGTLLVPALLAVGAFSDRWAFGLVVVVVGVGSLVDLHLTMGASGPRSVLPASLLLALGPVALVLVVPASAGAWIGSIIALGALVTFLLTLMSSRRHDTASIVGATLVAGLLVGLGATALLVLFDEVASTSLAGLLAVLALTDAAVTLAGQRTTAMARVALLAVVVVAVAGAGLWIATGRLLTVPTLAGFAVAVAFATVLTARFRRRLRSGTAPAPPRTALLIGTADGVLVAAPLSLLWLQLLTA